MIFHRELYCDAIGYRSRTHELEPRDPGLLARIVFTMRILGSLALDIALVVIFAVIGRASHAESLDLVGIATTAWPFVLSAALGSVVASWRNWPWWTQGVFVWVVALVGGMLLRLAGGGSTAVGFVIVGAIALAVFLIGWRALARKRLGTPVPVPVAVPTPEG